MQERMVISLRLNIARGTTLCSTFTLLIAFVRRRPHQRRRRSFVFESSFSEILFPPKQT